jgi:thiol-disulfide isomerase/thioredoxin
MQLKIVIPLVAAAGVTALVAGGAYHHLSTTNASEAAKQTPALSQAVEAPKNDGVFTMHEEPKPIPELQFVDGDGREINLAAFQGKAVLLNIWATWCVPCREEMPSLDRLQAKLGGPNFEVVALSIDREGLPAVKAFYQELSLTTLGIYVDESASAAYRLGTVGIPTTLLVNPDGLEQARLVGPAEWDHPDMVSLLQRELQSVKTASNR